MSEIKDKKIGIFEVESKRDLGGNEIKVKRYIHDKNRLYAYVRELSEKEKFASMAAGAEQSIVFKVNYNGRIRAGQFIEFRGANYAIVSVDGFEYYKRDLTLRAVTAKPEVYEYEEFTEH